MGQRIKGNVLNMITMMKKLKSVFASIIFILAIGACNSNSGEDEVVIVKPTVSNSNATNITKTTATVVGNITSDGGGTISSRGVYFSTSSDPKTNGEEMRAGSGSIGTFEREVRDLAPNTTYYYVAFATNQEGTSYGSVKSFTTNEDPIIVQTNEVSEVMAYSAKCGGQITEVGDNTVTEYGIVLSTTTG